MKQILDPLIKRLPATRLEPQDGSKIMTLEDIHRRHVIQIFGTGLGLAIAMIIYQLIFTALTSATYPALAMTVFACLGCIYGLWIGLWNQHPQNALRMLMVLFLAFTCLTLLLGGGLTKHNIAIVPVLPVIAALTLSPRDATFLAILHALMVTAVAIAWSGAGNSFISLASDDWHFPTWILIPLLALFITTSSTIYMTVKNQQAHIRLNDLLAKQAHLALHDHLSGLGNRVMLQQRLSDSDMDDEFDLLLIDLDGFKSVNDTYGHEAGDYVIKSVSDRLREVTEACDFVVRLGGDEFVILLENVDGELSDVRDYAGKVIEILSRPYAWQEGVLRIGASVGHARYPLHTDRPSGTLGLADKALYVAKEAGKGICATHDTAPPRKKKAKKRRFKLASPRHSRFI